MTARRDDDRRQPLVQVFVAACRVSAKLSKKFGLAASQRSSDVLVTRLLIFFDLYLEHRPA